MYQQATFAQTANRTLIPSQHSDFHQKVLRYENTELGQFLKILNVNMNKHHVPNFAIH